MSLERKKMKRKQKREDIISTAEKLFFSKGYDDVSMNDIAKDVGMSKATLYLYFDNKDSLFFAVVLRGAEIMKSLIEKEMGTVEKGIDKIFAYRNAYFDFALRYPDYLHIYNYFISGRFNLTRIVDNLVMKDVIERGRKFAMFPATMASSDENERQIMEIRKDILILLINSIKTGIEDGSIDKKIQIIEMAILIKSMTENNLNMPPDLVKTLEIRGINSKKYFLDINNLLNSLFKS
ncbi:MULTISPECIES: TetR/AcrR family transcriptional regulator [Methanobacterium]|jgi:AcrR family transcriptional regulator|uniref:TetR/AcrR family transcriptional regulator n=1 Tax=Methanobacterium veterum TaxID=408577 RepID=A0A9E4ZXI1_9EURY|nr:MULTISPECIES: TetR/AcrR family transcriptional regulator [Methanobacterium]MCZ3365423.1 TetR/AcrR family transcriptional regulator [Methanobacterium veterum]MCZ3373174.1 TetR/AcrR family transcriptional regulator [Methanobacterium veterum]